MFGMSDTPSFSDVAGEIKERITKGTGEMKDEVKECLDNIQVIYATENIERRCELVQAVIGYLKTEYMDGVVVTMQSMQVDYYQKHKQPLEPAASFCDAEWPFEDYGLLHHHWTNYVTLCPKKEATYYAQYVSLMIYRYLCKVFQTKDITEETWKGLGYIASAITDIYYPSKVLTQRVSIQGFKGIGNGDVTVTKSIMEYIDMWSHAKPEAWDLEEVYLDFKTHPLPWTKVDLINIMKEALTPRLGFILFTTLRTFASATMANLKGVNFDCQYMDMNKVLEMFTDELKMISQKEEWPIAVEDSVIMWTSSYWATGEYAKALFAGRKANPSLLSFKDQSKGNKPRSAAFVQPSLKPSSVRSTLRIAAAGALSGFLGVGHISTNDLTGSVNKESIGSSEAGSMLNLGYLSDDDSALTYLPQWEGAD